MTYSQAYKMLRENIGPGDLANKINNEILDCADPECELSIEDAEEILRYIAHQLTDE